MVFPRANSSGMIMLTSLPKRKGHSSFLTLTRHPADGSHNQDGCWTMKRQSGQRWDCGLMTKSLISSSFPLVIREQVATLLQILERGICLFPEGLSDVERVVE